MPQLENFALTMDSNFVLGSVPLIVVVQQKQFSTSSKEIRNKCFEFAQRGQNETPISHRNEGIDPTICAHIKTESGKREREREKESF